MIIQLNSQHSRDKYVICPRAPVTVAELRDRMLHRAKVIEGSYAYRLIDDLHSAIFVQSLDLKADYEAYFAREYASFSEFLRRRTRFPARVVTKLAKVFNVSSGMYHFRPYHAFLTETYGRKFLTRLLKDPPARKAS